MYCVETSWELSQNPPLENLFVWWIRAGNSWRYVIVCVKENEELSFDARPIPSFNDEHAGVNLGKKIKEVFGPPRPRPDSPFNHGNYAGKGHYGNDLYPNPADSPYEPIDAVDAAARNHDIAYHDAGIEFEGVFPSQRQIEIDQNFINTLRSIDPSTLTVDANQYRLDAIRLFETINYFGVDRPGYTPAIPSPGF